MISSEDAFSLLRKWQSEKASMKFLFSLSCGGGTLAGTIAEVTASTVQLLSADLLSELILSLREAIFEYGDAREAPPELKDKSGAKYAGCLTATVPSGERVCFFELRNLAPFK